MAQAGAAFSDVNYFNDRVARGTRQGVYTMQTIIKVVCGNGSQASMIDAYLVQYCEKAANETQGIEFPSPDDIAFAWDDANESRANCAEKPRAQLGSFRQPPN